MRDKYVAYLVTNLVNGKKYVGITSKGASSRWAAHRSRAKGGSMLLLHRAIRKYGDEAFSVDHIASSFSWDDLCTLEIQLISQYKTMGRSGYNNTRGGDGAFGYRLTPEQLTRLSVSHLGQERTPETRAKIAVASRGRKHTPEVRQKMSQIMKARFDDPEYRKKHIARVRVFASQDHWKKTAKANFARQMENPEMNAIWRNGHKGFKHSDETKQKMREKKLGRKLSPEMCQRMSEERKGKPKSDETRARMSAGKALWWAKKKEQQPLANPRT